MSAKAYLPTDYSSDVVRALETLRDAFINKRDQMLELMDTFRNDGDELNSNFANVSANTWRTAIDDIAIAIQKEQGR